MVQHCERQGVLEADCEVERGVFHNYCLLTALMFFRVAIKVLGLAFDLFWSFGLVVMYLGRFH